MYFILSKKYQKNGAPCFDQIGIIVADSIEQAVEKVGLPIVQRHDVANPPVSWVEMEQNFHLDSIPEWNGTLPDDASYDEPHRPSDNIKVPIPTTQDLYDGGILQD